MLFSKVDHLILIALTVAIVMSSIIIRPYIKEQMPLLNAGPMVLLGQRLRLHQPLLLDRS